MTTILYNPLAGHGRCEARAFRLSRRMSRREGQHVECVNMLMLSDVSAYLASCSSTDCVILCGGDGTIRWLMAHVDVSVVSCSLLYYPAGSCNDYYRDMQSVRKQPIPLSLSDLTQVRLDDNTLVLSGVGFGLDGTICELGRRFVEQHPTRSLNAFRYACMAFRQLLFDYQPTSATVVVDGVAHHFDNVWMAPTMHGRYYGGGLNCAPSQRRDNAEHTLTTVVVHGAHRWRMVIPFVLSYLGKHVLFHDRVACLVGKTVEVTFSEPRYLHVDGDTLPPVTHYKMCHE